MDGLLAIYAITISFELVLSLVMALILMMILAPGRQQNVESPGDDARMAKPLSPSLDVSLRETFRSISCGSDDLHTIIHTRRLLEQYQQQLIARD